MGRSRSNKRGKASPLATRRTSRAPGQGRASGTSRATAAASRSRGRAATAASKGRARKADEGDGETAPRTREIGALVLLFATLFLLLACASFGAGENLCGPTGELLAGALLGAFGWASYMLVACLGLWGVVLFLRIEAESNSVRASGVVLCLVSFSALFAHFFGSGAGTGYAPGGLVGEFINDKLMITGGLGLVGTRIVLVLLSMITFVLATGIAYYTSLVTGARWMKATGSSVRQAAVEARQRAALMREAAAQAAAVKAEETAAAEEEAARAKDEPSADDLEPFKVLEEMEGASVPEELDEEMEELDDEGEAQDQAEEDEDEEYEEEEEDDDEYEEEEDELEQEPGQGELLPLELTPQGGPVEAVAVEAGPYLFPSSDLLEDEEGIDQAELDERLSEKTEVLVRTLESFKVVSRVVGIQKGPVISMFEMELGPGIKVEKVRSLEDDLAIALRARTVRIVAPLPGRNTIGIEVPNPLRETVRVKPLLTCPEYTENKYALPVFLGRDNAGRPMIVDLAKMPHMLVAGSTGSGKSVCLNTIICSLLYTRTPEQTQMVLIDPKMVEMSQFGGMPHLACPVVSDMKRAPFILEWAVTKMEERYRLLHGAGVRNVYSYNKLGVEGLREHFGDRVDEEGFPRFLPFLVIIVDELADLMLSAAKEVETTITRLAAKSRAVGIHLILATQRPSTNVITGLIKANMPTRIAFMVSSKIDSRVILDVNGAEQLLGEGDMLFLPPHSSHVVRGQCAFISEEEIKAVMAVVKTSSGSGYEPELVQRRSEPAANPSEVDALYDAAVRFMIQTQRGSASLLQRKFAIGYTRASRLIDLMAEEGVLGEYKGSQAREVTLSLEDWIALDPEARASDEDSREDEEGA